MTLKTLLAQELTTVFGDVTNGFAYSITRWIHGDPQVSDTLTAVIDGDDLQGAQQRNGPTSSNSDSHGQRTVQSVTLAILTPGVEYHADDKFVLPSGQVVAFIKRVGYDEETDTADLLCMFVEGITSKGPRLRQ